MATLSDFLCEWDNSSPFIVAHTSGSTGTPKEIHLLKEDMRRSARATNSFFGIDSNSVLGIPLSMDYIAGKMMAVRAIEAHCRLLELPVSNRIELPEDVDLLSVVPSQAAVLLNNEPSLKRAGCLLIGGAPLDISTEQRLFGAGVEAYVGYGMTETCSHVAFKAGRELGRNLPRHAGNIIHTRRTQLSCNNLRRFLLENSDHQRYC